MATESVSATELCAVNIGPKERRKRVAVGAVGIAVGVGLAFGLAASAARPLRFITAIPFFVGALGFFQARAKT